jgi:hypothetical protein
MCKCLVRWKDFDVSHDSWVSRKLLTPLALQDYEQFLTEHVRFCEERDKNSKLPLLAIAGTSKTSDVVPITPTVGEAVVPILHLLQGGSFVDLHSTDQLEGPTSPRIVTRKQHSKEYVDTARCTVNTFIINTPFLTLLSPHRPSGTSGSSLSWELSREQYLGSLNKRTLKQN